MKISDFKEKIDDIRLDENKKEEIWEHLNSSSKKKHNYFLRIANVAAIVAGVFIVANVGTYVYAGETLISKITRKWVGNTTKEFNESDINEINSEREYDDYKYTVCDCIYDEAASEVYFNVNISKIDGGNISYSNNGSVYYVEDGKEYKTLFIIDERQYAEKNIAFGMFLDGSTSANMTAGYEIVENEMNYYGSCGWSPNVNAQINFCIFEVPEDSSVININNVENLYQIKADECKKCESINIDYNNEKITISPYSIRITSNHEINDSVITINYKDGSINKYEDVDYSSVEYGTQEGISAEKKIITKKIIDISQISTVTINNEIIFSC